MTNEDARDHKNVVTMSAIRSHRYFLQGQTVAYLKATRDVVVKSLGVLDLAGPFFDATISTSCLTPVGVIVESSNQAAKCRNL